MKPFCRYFIIIASMTLLLNACKKENNPCLKSTGSIQREMRSVPDNIRVIKLEKNINLFIEQDTFNAIVIEAGENLMDFIDTDVEGDMLTITNNNKCNFLRSFRKDINAYLTIKDIDSVECNGSGNLTIADTFYTDRVVFNLSRTTGDIDVAIHCKSGSRFNLHQGVSNVTIRGYTRSNVAYNSGHGYFFMKDLYAYFHQVNSASSGDCIVGKVHTMFVLLNSSGDIIYYEKPEELDIWEYHGSGKLIDKS